MLRFTKETDWQRINRLKNSIINDYVKDDKEQELLISESDLVFILEKAEEQINFEAESDNQQNTPNNNDLANEISQIDMYKNGNGGQVF